MFSFTLGPLSGASYPKGSSGTNQNFYDCNETSLTGLRVPFATPEINRLCDLLREDEKPLTFSKVEQEPGAPQLDPQQRSTESIIGRMHCALSITSGSAVSYLALAATSSELLSAVLGIGTFITTLSRLISRSEAKLVEVEGERKLTASYSDSFCRTALPMLLFSGYGFKTIETVAPLMLGVQVGLALCFYGHYFLNGIKRTSRGQ